MVLLNIAVTVAPVVLPLVASFGVPFHKGIYMAQIRGENVYVDVGILGACYYQ
jgi:hypothetical protein